MTNNDNDILNVLFQKTDTVRHQSAGFGQFHHQWIDQPVNPSQQLNGTYPVNLSFRLNEVAP